MKSFKLLIRFFIALVILIPSVAVTDQTDARLDELFETLKTSQTESVLQETEASIWEIWFESGLDDIDIIMAQAGNAVNANELALAEAMYSQVIEKAPNFSEGWNRRATVRFYRNDYQGSIEDIQRTLALEPRHFGAVWGLGMILGSERDYSGAITAFERLLELKPHARDAKPRIELLKKELAKSAV